MRVTDDDRLWTMQEPFGAFTRYAVNDHPSDKARYDVRVSAPGRWVGVSNGRLVSKHRSGGRTVTRWTNRDPMASYLLTLAVGPYRAYRQRGPRDLPITHWVPRDETAIVEPLLRTRLRCGGSSGGLAGSRSTRWERSSSPRLRVLLGDDTFDRLARSWPQARMHGNADRADLVSWWSAQSGRDLAPFFETWLDSPASRGSTPPRRPPDLSSRVG